MHARFIDELMTLSPHCFAVALVPAEVKEGLHPPPLSHLDDCDSPWLPRLLPPPDAAVAAGLPSA